MIERHGDGLNANVGSVAGVFSGGTRIATALSKDPPILILDGATSALDAATEANVGGAQCDEGPHHLRHRPRLARSGTPRASLCSTAPHRRERKLDELVTEARRVRQIGGVSIPRVPRDDNHARPRKLNGGRARGYLPDLSALVSRLDSDGVGDLKSAFGGAFRSRGLGVNAVWIRPLQVAMADFGYDVAGSRRHRSPHLLIARTVARRMLSARVP